MTTRYQDIQKEHAAIRQTIARIQTELDRLPVPQEGGWPLPAMVGALRQRLKRHFELEESGGLLGSAIEYYDAVMQREARELIAEHRGFERDIDHVCAELDACDAPPAADQERIAGELRKLIAALGRHESVETSLLERLVSGKAGVS